MGRKVRKAPLPWGERMEEGKYEDLGKQRRADGKPKRAAGADAERAASSLRPAPARRKRRDAPVPGKAGAL